MRRSVSGVLAVSACAAALTLTACASTSNSAVGDAALTSTGMRAAPAGPLTTSSSEFELVGDTCANVSPCVRGIDFNRSTLVVGGKDTSILRDVESVSAKLVDASGSVVHSGGAAVSGDRTSVGSTRWDAWWSTDVPLESLTAGSTIKFKWEYKDCPEVCDVVTTATLHAKP